MWCPPGGAERSAMQAQAGETTAKRGRLWYDVSVEKW